jgi:glycosyltransferase involved in cell wall biosynthesis
MTVYNHEATVEKALESVLMQEMSYRSVIYCLNDASTDRSGEILSEYAKKYPDKIKVYTSPVNLGLGKKAILYHQPPAEGKYWCLLPGDDFLTARDKLAKQIAFLDSHSDFVGCSCNTVLKNEVTGDESLIQPSRNTWNMFDLILLKHKYAFYVHTTSFIWRNVYQDQGSFLPPLFRKDWVYGDVMLAYLMLGKGGKIRNIPEVMSCYRVTGRGEWTKRSEEEQAKLNKLLEEKIQRLIPIKYKIILHLQVLRARFPIIKKLVPGPINE